ncbi:MAG: tetratricopeptide repeat protein [Candidatus Methylomirabilis sp.]|nr:tetratricopeptide repeat protein [Deltaproteobacteria bacterium]
MKKSPFLPAAVIAALTFAAYVPSLWNGFVNWDDPYYVFKNPYILAIESGWTGGISAWLDLLTSSTGGNWHPLTMSSLAIDYLVWGRNPFGFHLTNSIFHALNTFLAGALSFRIAIAARKDLSQRPVFLLVGIPALLFGLHPMHVESVAWVSERKDVLSVFFILLTFLMYFRYSERRLKRHYALSIVFFILALLSKPMAVTVPLALLIIDYYPLRRLAGPGLRRALIEKVPFLVLSALLGVVTMLTQKTVGAVISMGFAAKLAIASRAVVFYLYKLIIPIGLAPVYPVDFSAGPLTIIVYGLIAAFITGVCIYLLRFSRAPLAAWLFYLVTLAPVSGIIKAGEQAAADRYTYLPTLGLFFLLGGVLSLLAGRGRRLEAPFTAGALALLALLGYGTISQAAIWKDSLSLWSRQVELYPDHFFGYNKRGVTYKDLGMNKESLADLDEAVRLAPGVSFIYSHRAHTRIAMNDYRGAIEDFSIAIDTNPKYSEAYIARGTAYSEVGMAGPALSDFSEALRLDPKAAPAYFGRARAKTHMGDLRGAVEDFSAAINIDRRYTDAYIMRGIAHAELGLMDAAIADFNAAIRSNPKEPKGYSNKARALALMGRHQEAVKTLTALIDLGPDNGIAYSRRGEAHAATGEYGQAIADFKQALLLKPDDARTHLNLGLAYNKAGDPAEASVHFKAAAGLGLSEALTHIREEAR